MKLHEFTDRLYAMGGIEQKEKRSRILTEGDTSGWGSYETQHPVVAKCKIEPYKNWYISNLEDVDPDDSDIFTRDIEQAYVFTSDYWENELQEILDEYTDGYTTEDFVPIWYDSTLEPYLDKNRKNESLNESIKIANEVNLNESFSYDFFEKPCSMLHDKLNEDAYDFIDTDPLVQSILKKYPYAFKIPKDERLIIKKEVEKRANEIIDKYRKRITKAFVEQASDYIFGSLNFHELNVTESLYRNNKVEK